jgi:hypothetical protein
MNDAIRRKNPVGCRHVSAVQTVDPGLLECGHVCVHLQGNAAESAAPRDLNAKLARVLDRLNEIVGERFVRRLAAISSETTR